MFEILNKEFLNNTIGAYLVVAAVIFSVFLLKKFAAHSVAEIIFSFINKRWKTIGKAAFKDLVTKPLGLFLAVLIAVIALDGLTLPGFFDFKVYHISFAELLRMVASSLLIITFFLFIIKCIDFIALVIKARYLQDGDIANHQLFFFFKDFLKVIVGIIAVIFVLKYSFDYDVKGLITGLSIVGAAIALALKESLENLIASFIIFFDKPFATGDVVKVNNVSGTIERIGLRSTRIRSDAKTYITVPNKQMVDTILDNLSNRTQRRADLKLELATSTGPQKVQQFIDGMKKILTHPEIENSNVYLTDITSLALLVACDYFTGPININDFNGLKQDINMKALQLLDSLEIEIAGKATDIKIINNDPQPAKPSSLL